MRTSCIAHPANEALIIIRSWQVEACDNNHCAAALLSFFEYWHSIRLDQRSKSIKQNAIAERHGDIGGNDTTLLQFHNEGELEAGLLGLFKRDKIRKAIALLIKKGFVSQHRNPNPRYAFDQTRYFLFHAETIAEWLQKRLKPLETPITEKSVIENGKIGDGDCFFNDGSRKIDDRRRKNDIDLYTEISTETTAGEEEYRSKCEPCREETPARDFVHPVRDFDRKMSEPLPPWRTSKGPNGIKPEFVAHFQERMKAWGKDSNPSIANAKSAIIGMERSQDESKRDRLQLDWEDFVERSSRKNAASQQQNFEEQRHQECLALIESLQCWIKAGKILRIEYLKGQSVYAVLANSKNGERTHERHLKWEVEQWRNELVCA